MKKILAIVFVIFIAIQTHAAQMAVNPIWQILDHNGDPVSGGVIYFYDVGTTTPRIMYSDCALSSEIGTSITLNTKGMPEVSGSVVPIYTEGAYKILAVDADGATIYTVDDVRGAAASLFNFDTVGAAGNYATLDAALDDSATNIWLLEDQTLSESEVIPSGTTVYTNGKKIVLGANNLTFADGSMIFQSVQCRQIFSENGAGAVTILWNEPIVYVSWWGSGTDALLKAEASFTTGTLVLDDDATVDTDTTIDATKTFRIVDGAVISRVSAETVTINGRLEAGRCQITDADMLSFGPGAIDEAFPEWWGVDGENDQVQINYALSSCSVVKLMSDKNYILGSGITPASDSALIAQDWSTVITMDFDGTGISINDVVNFKAAGFKMTAADRSGSVTLQISGTSSDITLDDIWLYDGSVHAFRIRPGEDETIERVNINRMKIDTGCSSAAFTLSNDASSGNGSIRNIYVDGLDISNVDSIGVSNNANRLDATSDTNSIKNIFYTNISIKNTGSIGFAASAQAENIFLDGFTIDTTASSGVQVETVDGFLVQNGNISGAGANGIVLTETGGAFTRYSAKSGKITGVKISGSAQNGLQYLGSSGYPVKDVIVSGCHFYENGSNGIAMAYADGTIIDGNFAWDNGGAGGTRAGLSMPGSSALTDKTTIINNHFYGSDQDYGISIGKGSIHSNVICKNNQCYGNNVLDVRPIDATGDLVDIEAESEIVTINLALIAADGTEAVPVFTAPGPNGTVILDCEIALDLPIAADGTNYVEFIFRDKGDDGTSSNKITSVNTNTGGDNVSFSQFDTVSMGTYNTPNTTHKYLSPGTICTLYKSVIGGGQDVDWVTLRIKYISF